MLGVPRQLAGLRIPAKLKPAETAFREVWVRLLTRELLVLALPDRDTAARPRRTARRRRRAVLPGGALRPRRSCPVIRRSSFPAVRRRRRRNVRARLRAACEGQPRSVPGTVMAFDRSRGEGFGTGARDWRRIVERMNWATTMLRTRIQDGEPLWPPFRDEDAERIMKGRLPLHPGNPTDFDVLGPLEGFTYSERRWLRRVRQGGPPMKSPVLAPKILDGLRLIGDPGKPGSVSVSPRGGAVPVGRTGQRRPAAGVQDGRRRRGSRMSTTICSTSTTPTARTPAA